MTYFLDLDTRREVRGAHCSLPCPAVRPVSILVSTDVCTVERTQSRLTQLTQSVWSVVSSPPATAAAQGSILSSAGPQAPAELWRPRQARHALSSSQPSMSTRVSVSQLTTTATIHHHHHYYHYFHHYHHHHQQPSLRKTQLLGTTRH